MSDPCRWNGREQPRIVPNRHEDDCPGDCTGCLACSEDHCRVCRRVHAEGTCAECLSKAREALHDIGRMCPKLPGEAILKGVDSTAAMLWGPVSDPEARQFVEASYMSGRLPEGWIEASHGKECPLLRNDACTGCAGGELHPLTVLGTWQMVVADSLEHDLGDGPVTVPDALAYIDRQMTYLAGYDLLPFEDLARDIRRCAGHMRAVLHDQNQGDIANVDCFECGSHIERQLTKTGFEDRWTCQRCHQTYTPKEYNFALRAKLEDALANREPA